MITSARKGSVLLRTILILLLALVPALSVAIQAAAPAAAAVGTVAPMNNWPATPQLTGTTGNMAGSFTISSGTDRLLVVLVSCYNNFAQSGQTFSATYGGKTLTQAVLQNNNRRGQTWIGYLKESDIASRTGNTVTVTITGIHTNVTAYIASYKNVDQTTPVTASASIFVDNNNNQPVGGPLNVNAGGYGIYGWASMVGPYRISDNESYTEHSDTGEWYFNYGVASKAFSATTTTNPSVTWSGYTRVSFSFITLNPDRYPAPTTTGISPTAKTVGDAGFDLTVYGTNFVSGASVVRLGGAARTTTFVSSTQLTATIPASDLTTAGTRSITVFNPTPGGGTSNVQTLTVNNPPWLDTVSITGTVEAVIDVTAPDDFSISLMPGITGTSAAQSVTVKCNDAGWTLAVSGTNGGHMNNASYGNLTNPTYLAGGDLSGYQPLTSMQNLEDGTGAVAGITTISGITFQQTPTWNDPVGDYTITVTFTGTIN